MLTDTPLRNLKPKPKIYKVFDRDGMCVAVSTAGTITFRYDCRLNERRETLTLGRYGPAGMSLAMARERLLDAKRSVFPRRSARLCEGGAHDDLNWNPFWWGGPGVCTCTKKITLDDPFADVSNSGSLAKVYKNDI